MEHLAEHIVNGLCFFLSTYSAVKLLAPLMPEEDMTEISVAALKKSMLKALVGCSMIAVSMLGGLFVWKGVAAVLGWDASLRSILMAVGIIWACAYYPK